jgi:hypothetical protein
MTDERQTVADALAESIAASLWEFNHTLSFTGLDPDQLLQCGVAAFAKMVPGFKDAPEEAIQDFADRLGVALCDRMIIERDILLMQRRGVTPS